MQQKVKRPRGEKPWVRARVVLPRPGVPARGHYRPKEPEDWYSQKRTLKTHVSNKATDGLTPSVLVIFRAQLEQILAFFRQRAKKTRGEQPRVRIRVVFPRPGVPGRGHCRPKFQHGF